MSTFKRVKKGKKEQNLVICIRSLFIFLVLSGRFKLTLKLNSPFYTNVNMIETKDSFQLTILYSIYMCFHSEIKLQH